MPATLDFKLIVAYFNDPQCNCPIEDDGEWMINENVIFNYSETVDDTFLHMPLSMISVTSMPVDSGESPVFMIPPSKRSQSPVVFGRVQPRMFVVTDSSSNSEPL